MLSKIAGDFTKKREQKKREKEEKKLIR